MRLSFTVILTIAWGLVAVWAFGKAVRKYESANFVGSV
jgi:hypothetical protein